MSKPDQERQEPEVIEQVELVSAKPIGKPSVVERILSPKALMALMSSGGGLLVVGFAIWLWSKGVFENPIILCVSVGAINLVLIGLGSWMVSTTRFQLSGRGLALLGSLSLPLNLWLYHGQGLITISEGGHLWIPALFCCLIYAVTARILRDATFVYTLMGGIVLTGLLFLADQSVNQFFATIPVATFLIVLGSVGVLAERWFQQPVGAFSNKEFGTAFRRSGLIVLFSGLAFLMGAQLIWHQLEWVFADATSFQFLWSAQEKFWAVGLLAVASTTFAYARFARKSKMDLGPMSLFTAIWCVATLVDALSLVLTLPILLNAMAIGCLAWLVMLRYSQPRGEQASKNLIKTFIPPFAALFALGLIQTGEALLTVALPVHFTTLFGGDWTFMTFSGALVLGFGCLGGLVRQTSLKSLGQFSWVLGTLALLHLVAVMGMGAGVHRVDILMLCMAIVPVVGLLLGRGLSNAELRYDVLQVAAVALTATLAWAGLSTLKLDASPFGSSHWTWIFLTYPVIYLGCSWPKFGIHDACMSVACLVFATINFLTMIDVPLDYAVLLGVALVGVLATGFDRTQHHLNGSSSSIMLNVGNSAIVMSVGAALLLTLGRMATKDTHSAQILIAATLFMPIFVAWILTPATVWKDTLKLASLVNLVTMLLVLIYTNELSWLHRAQILFGGVGVVMLIFGHRGFIRSPFLQATRTEGETDAQLFFGSIAMLASLGIGVFENRFLESSNWYWNFGNELGTVLVAIMLLVSGILLQIRATTLSGGIALLGYILSLVCLINVPDQLQQKSVMIMVGGGLIFGIGVLLSIYRERVLQLPQKIRDGKGVFQVLKWK